MFSSVNCILIVLLTSSINVRVSSYHGGYRRLSADKSINNKDAAYKSRIFGGKIANILKHPYMVYITEFCEDDTASEDSAVLTYECGGAIIGKKWILTAAHCSGNNDTEVYAGSDKIYKGTLYHIKKATRHPEYQPNAAVSAYDIMVIELTRDLRCGPNVEPIILGNAGDLVDGKIATIAGFGSTETTRTRLCGLIELQNKENKQLREVKLPIILHDHCLEINGIAHIVFESDFCAGYTNRGMGACHGDSGSPLVINGRVVGVMTSGHNETCGKWPDVYVSVPLATPWINKVIGK